LSLLAASGEVETAPAKRPRTTIAKSATPTATWSCALTATAAALRVDQGVGCADEDSSQKNDSRLFHAVRDIHIVFDVAEQSTVVSNLLNGQ
jgi:hypothetical protein